MTFIDFLKILDTNLEDRIVLKKNETEDYYQGYFIDLMNNTDLEEYFHCPISLFRVTYDKEKKVKVFQLFLDK